MVTAEYKIAYSEVLEILKHISKEEYNKIPQNMIKTFKVNASTENDFKYNPNKTLQEQNVSETTRTIIAILFRDYWASKEQREKISSVQNIEREKYRQEQYNPNNLFKNKRKIEIKDENVQTENVAMIEYKEPLLIRFLNKIKRLFGK